MTGAGGGRRGRLFALVAACALVAGSVAGLAPLSDGPPSAAAASVPPWPIDPSDPAIASEWGDAAGRSADRGVLDLTVDAVTPQVADVTGTVAVRVTVRNKTDSPVRDVMIRTQRGEALAGAAQARTVLAAPEQSLSVATSFGDPFSLDAGESTTRTLEVDLGDAAPAGLGVTEPGVYPVLLNANGRPDEGIDQFLAETRWLLPVRATESGADAAEADRDGGEGATGSARGTAPGSSERTARRGTPEDDPPVPVSLLWPLAANVPLLPGETGEAPDVQDLILRNDSLATELSGQGRLDGLLAALESELAGPEGPGLRQSTCVAVDPELILTVDRMAGGYQVGDRRPSPVETSTRLRDSWGAGSELRLRDGEGATAAAEWLERLRTVAADMCVVTLPWAGAELNAVAATGDADLAAEALAVGDGIVSEILRVKPIESVVVPPEGYLTPNTPAMLRYADPVGAIDPGASFEALHRGENAAGPATWPTGATGPVTALVAANSLSPEGGGLAQPGETVGLVPEARAFAVPAPLSAALAATGARPESVGYASIDGRHDLTADSSVARMQTAVGTLHQELADAVVRAGDGDPAPVVAMPPAGWSVGGDEARALLRGVAAAYDDGVARPVPLGDALESSAGAPGVGAGSTMAPNPDPGAVAGTEMVRAKQQSGHLTTLALMMANDPQVALTRHGFTQPLRRDMLRSLTGTGRREREGYLAATNRAAAIHDGTGSMLQQLRDSVALVAPGGVYTRFSGLSPVVVVGRNGLPLPVPAAVQVSSDSGEPVAELPATLPAKGSVTLQLPVTAESDDDGNSRLRMWLETPASQRISAPVQIVVRTGPGPAAVVLPLALIALAAGAFVVGRSGRFQRIGRIRPQWGRD